MKKLGKKITSKEFDKRFDSGKDMGRFLNVGKAKTNKKIQRINMVNEIYIKSIDQFV